MECQFRTASSTTARSQWAILPAIHVGVCWNEIEPRQSTQERRWRILSKQITTRATIKGKSIEAIKLRQIPWDLCPTSRTGRVFELFHEATKQLHRRSQQRTRPPGLCRRKAGNATATARTKPRPQKLWITTRTDCQKQTIATYRQVQAWRAQTKGRRESQIWSRIQEANEISSTGAIKYESIKLEHIAGRLVFPAHYSKHSSNWQAPEVSTKN